MQSPRLILLAPGLLGPLPERQAARSMLPSLPGLQRVLSRARIVPGAGEYAHELRRWLGDAPGHSPPEMTVGALSARGDGCPQATLHADPVHLKTDLTKAILFGPFALEVSRGEADALAQTFNGHFAPDGLSVCIGHPERWYLQGLPATAMMAPPLESVIGRNVDPRLPHGPEQGHWHRLLNEIQMLFFEHPVNQAREAQGQPPINSVWIWGTDSLPPAARSGDAAVARVWADEPLARGLAEYVGRPLQACPERWADQPIESRNSATAELVVWDAARAPALHGDLPAWRDAVARFERDWVHPALEALLHHRLDRLTLSDGERRFQLDRGAARRFWKKDRPVSFYLDA